MIFDNTMQDFTQMLMSLSYNIVGFIIMITTIVFVHEFGHFYFARLFGVKIEVFSIGFGRAILWWNDKKGTKWKLGWIPMGGYVKMYGDVNVVSGPDIDKLAKMSEIERKQSFYYQSIWKKVIIVAAGPFANYVLAIIIITWIYFLNGTNVVSPEITDVALNMPASNAGLKIGDVVVKIDNKDIKTSADIMSAIQSSNGASILVTVNRNESKNYIKENDNTINNINDISNVSDVNDLIDIEVNPEVDAKVSNKDDKGDTGDKVSLGREYTAIMFEMRPEIVEEENNFGAKVRKPVIGLKFEKMNHISLGFFNAAVLAIKYSYDISILMFYSIIDIVMGNGDLKEIGGPIKIAQYSGKSLEVGFDKLLQLIAVISLNLGFVNLLPIPLLDGGHLMYYILQGFSGKPLSIKFQNAGYVVGFFILMLMMFFAIFNDLKGLFS